MRAVGQVHFVAGESEGVLEEKPSGCPGEASEVELADHSVLVEGR